MIVTKLQVGLTDQFGFSGQPQSFSSLVHYCLLFLSALFKAMRQLLIMVKFSHNEAHTQGLFSRFDQVRWKECICTQIRKVHLSLFPF